MEINVITKTENPVLDRTEIEFECVYQGESTPKILDVKSKLVAILDANKNLLIIDNIQPSYGEGKGNGYAKIYNSEESLNKIETKHIIEKNQEVVEESEEEE